MRSLLSAILLVVLAVPACSGRSDDGTIALAVVGSEESMFDSSLRLSFAGQLVREATAEGLVALDAQGEIIPGIAERWIVTDDGLSFIFRVRNSDWSNGEPIDAESVRRSLLATIDALDGTSLGIDLEKIDEIRAMTARVIEIRLKSPMPEFLQLLAQPELGLRLDGRAAGLMRLQRVDDRAVLTPVPPEERGLPARPEWSEDALTISLRAMSAGAAVEAFRNAEVEAVLNGRLSTLPLADLGPLSRGTIRLDAALGLFGLTFNNADGLLAEASRREALSMAIDRPALLAPFNVAGWIPTTRIVAPDLPRDPGALGERWSGQSLEERRAEARRRIADYSGEGTVRLTIFLPDGPGSELLLQQLAADFSTIGVRLERADLRSQADLELVDRLARYANARWFLNQFNCAVAQPICSPDADVLVDQSLDAATAQEQTNLLVEAESALTAAEAYIPLGAPIRWSLVRGGLEGYSENRWGRHPLFPIATAPIF
ncbi:ABC transporter substrate-binding protein [Erythrobacter litoralis]|uniref:Putative dipeptide-binding ABC transporter protein n=1 Tax=Erythrobacter litoralis (strain HTCC2594) TaxID=314225 RepID=Q2N5X3_ERYLH|nr:ABC transporter substrate-binding protein [Erythrobacter litoralis]ABC64918.1 putative dipeptide-binding ABC transporter protein [Erythrobacter litoralis HTCC2594]